MVDYPRPSKIATLERLRTTWLASKDAVRIGRRGGIDSVTPEQFRSRLEENLQKVRQRLLDPQFDFNPLRAVFIPKSGGAYRTICVPTIADRLIQRLILDYLVTGDKLGVTNKISYGFRKNFGVPEAINVAKKLRREHRWVLKSDIQSFFDTIQRDLLKDDVRRRLGRSSLVPIICKAIDAEIYYEDIYDKRRAAKAGIQQGRGLRQGMPLSPILSNMVLRTFDKVLIARHVRTVRYADDFIVLADSEGQCREAFSLIRDLLSERGHTAPEPGQAAPGQRPKTSIYQPNESVEFLGFELCPKAGGYAVMAPQAAFQEIFELLMPFRSFEVASKRWSRFSNAIASANAKISGFVNVYRQAQNFDSLRAHALVARGEAVRDLLESVFGRDILKDLDERRQSFLDLLGTQPA